MGFTRFNQQPLEFFEWIIYYELNNHECSPNFVIHNKIALVAEIREKSHMRLPESMCFWGNSNAKSTYGTTPTNPSIVWETSVEVEDMHSNTG